jgi:hypothetical protein
MGGQGHKHEAKSSMKAVLLAPCLLLGSVAIYFLVAPDPFEPAKQSVKRTLFDPQSAQFEDLRTADGPDGAFVCGTVNAKNRLGGYVGKSLFAYRVETDMSEVIRTGRDAFLAGELMLKTCFPRINVPMQPPGPDAEIELK